LCNYAAQELSMANHPHIVEMKGAFLTPYYLALVMEYVEGETLEVKIH
jgi:serine/threonine protein kinase